MPLPEYPFDLSLVCPAYNEQESLELLLKEWDDQLRSTSLSYEMILVDDGSTDSTPELMTHALRTYQTLRVLRMDRRSGQSSALVAGFRAARGCWIVTSDADLQNDPADLPKFLELTEAFDVVCGWRWDRKDSWTKRQISRFANASRRRLLDDDVHDTGCGMKLIHRNVVERILEFDGMHRFLPALAKIEGFRVAEVPVRHRPRIHGKSKYWIFNRFLRPIEDLRGVAWYRRRRLRYAPVEITNERRIVTPISKAARNRTPLKVYDNSSDKLAG